MSDQRPSKTVVALRAARQALEHEPENCWATGPRTGSILDLIACPGCSAIKLIDEALSATDEPKPQADEPSGEPVAEVHSGTLRWLVDDDHPIRQAGHAYLYQLGNNQPNCEQVGTSLPPSASLLREALRQYDEAQVRGAYIAGVLADAVRKSIGEKCQCVRCTHCMYCGVKDGCECPGPSLTKSVWPELDNALKAETKTARCAIKGCDNEAPFGGVCSAHETSGSRNDT